MPVIPTLKSYLIADMVFQERDGKWCIIGVFDGIFAPRYPWILSSLGLFIQVADAEGDYEVKVEFRDASDRVLSILPGMKLAIKDRLAVVGVGIPTHQLVIPAPGKYRFCLNFNGEMIGDIPLEAMVIEGGKQNV